jgi:hypothetical protein
MQRTIGIAVASALVAAGVVALAGARRGEAEEPAYELRFLSLTGEGSTTKAWYEGAPPSGVKVQEALDRFAQQGFRLAGQAPAWRQGQVNVSSSSPSSTTVPDPAWILLLERGRR